MSTPDRKQRGENGAPRSANKLPAPILNNGTAKCWPSNFDGEMSIARLSPFASPMTRRNLKKIQSPPPPTDTRRSRRAFSLDARAEDVEEQLLALTPSRYGSVEDQKWKETVGSTFLQTTFNGINLLLGVGVLSLPFAFKMTGWVVGAGLLLVLSVLTNHTGKLIGRIIQKHPDIRNFPDIGQAALGTKGRAVIAVLFYLELASACSMYLILMADNLHKLFPQFSRGILTLISAAVVTPTTWTKHLSWLAYFSIVGVIASMFLLLVLIIVGMQTPSTLGAPGSYLQPQETVLFTNPANWPLCVGVVMVGFAGHAVFPNLYTEMRDPKDYSTTLNITYGVVVVVYGAIASLGYLMFGIATKQEVTLNLMDSGGSFLPVFATCLIIVNPFTKFALTLHPVSSAVEELLFPTGIQTTWQGVQSILVRSFLSGAITFIAVGVPHFARLLSFVGALCSFTVSGWFPCLCYAILFRKDVSQAEIAGNLLIALVCLLLGIGGTLASFFAPDEPQ